MMIAKMASRTSCLFFIILIILFFSRPAQAVRPFVTDDARVVGRAQAQIETSVRWDKERLQHLNLFALGPTERLELTAGFIDGFPLEDDVARVFAIAGPLMQAKYLLLDTIPNGRPGLAIAGGGSPPMGSGSFKPETWREFAYMAMTASFFDNDRVLLHWNVGFTTDNYTTKATCGIGTQFRIVGGLNGVAEIFQNDPYGGDTGGAYQAGFRYAFSDYVQVDMTGGTGFFGKRDTTAYYGMGVRFVTEKLWK